MIFLSTVTNSVSQLFSDGVRRMRVITASLFGAKVAPEASPAGYDGNPIPGLAAVFAETSKKGKPVFIGYINANQLSDVGEVRVYATDANGVEKAKIWAHNDGTVEIGGTSDIVNPNNLVQYQALELLLSNYFTAQNTAIATGVTSAGGSYTPPAPIDLSTAKATKLLIE